MDFHPIVVHFPVALLSCYTLMELVRLKRLLETETWFWIKAVFLVIGSAATLIAYKTGEFAAGETRSILVATHARSAKITTILFGFLAFLYIVRVFAEWFGEKYPIISKLYSITEKIRRHWGITVLALIGFWFITATGALGGAIVYGPNVDPFVSLIYRLVVK